MYHCECCNFTTKIKTHYNTHLKTKKHLRLSEISQKLAEISQNTLDEVDERENDTKVEMFACKYCDKLFKHKSSLCKHIKYSCKKNKDEDLQELIRLLNEKNERLNEKNDRMQKQIDRLVRKLKVQNIGTQNQNNGTINNYNVKLLNYTETDYSHLTNTDYAKCVSDCNHCVKTLIDKVHFNKKKPENMNVYIASMKDKYIMVYKDNNWTLQNRKTIIDRMFIDNECEIDMWVEEHSEEYPELVKTFERYQTNKSKEDIEQQVKDMIILDMYNRREIVKDNSDDFLTENQDIDELTNG